MSEKKKIIIFLLAILIIFIITIIGVFYTNREEENDEDELSSETSKVVEEEEKVLGEVSSRNNFYSIQSCIEKFYAYYASVFNPEEEDVETCKENLYNLLDEEYIAYKNITSNNITEKLEAINSSIVNVNEMYEIQKSNNINIYIAKGRLRETGTSNMSDFELMLKVDSLNKTFAVLLEDYIEEYYSDYEVGENIEIEVPKSIEKNDNNLYDYIVVTDETYAIDLLSKYKEEVLFDTETAYNHLDEEYREKRFESLEEFQEYAKNKVKNNVMMKLNKYQKTNYGDYTTYVCIDQKGNYYIFRETAVMKYGLILDTYTIDLPEFIEKYDSANDEDKCAYNIDKMVTAINSGDYKYVYNKLNETYKNNYFPDIETFKEFINNNFFESNELTSGQFEIVGENYSYKIKITNSNNTEETKTITVIMKLLEDRDFEIAFSIEE